MKKPKQGLITKVLLLCFAVYAAVTLLSLTASINEQRAAVKGLQTELRDQEAKTERREAELESEKERLTGKAQDEEDDNADPASGLSDEQVAEIARDRLGLVYPGEKVFYIVNK